MIGRLELLNTKMLFVYFAIWIVVLVVGGTWPYGRKDFYRSTLVLVTGLCAGGISTGYFLLRQYIGDVYKEGLNFERIIRTYRVQNCLK